jgi:DNA topoisomerase IB
MATQPSHAAPELPVAPEASAQAAGLHYVSDTQPGIRRQRTGRGFCGNVSKVEMIPFTLPVQRHID